MNNSIIDDSYNEQVQAMKALAEKLIEIEKEHNAKHPDYKVQLFIEHVKE